jgi:cell division transport system permease protein
MGVIAVLMMINAVLIIITITSMKIALKREEIEILRLVGASRWYVRLPFVWEGGLYGAAGAAAAWVIIVSVVVWLREMLMSFLGVVPEINTILSAPTGQMFIGASLALLGCLLSVGFILGAFGSMIAVNRYLRS